MTLQTRKQIIIIHILPKISRSKRKQTMKFRQLIEHNIIKNFLEKSSAKYDGEVSPRSFYKNKSKLCISPDQQSEMF